MDDDPLEVVITAPDTDWLIFFTTGLVTDGLAACGHTVAPIRSQYRWNNTLHENVEARVSLHTVRRHLPAIIDRTNRDHPYDVPCVIATAIIGGNPAYLAWIRAETLGPLPEAATSQAATSDTAP